MLEEKLLSKGVTPEELASFARMDYNDQKNTFRILVEVQEPHRLLYHENGFFISRLFSVLKEEGKKNWEKYFPDTPKEKIESAGNFVAAEMLKRLSINHPSSLEYTSIDDLYRDTFHIQKEEGART